MTPDNMEGRLALRLRVDPDFVSVQVDREDLRALLLDYRERGRALEDADRRLSRPDWTVQRDTVRSAIRATLKGKSHD